MSKTCILESNTRSNDNKMYINIIQMKMRGLIRALHVYEDINQ